MAILKVWDVGYGPVGMGVRGVCVGMCMWHGVVCVGRVCLSVWRLEPGPHAPNLLTH